MATDPNTLLPSPPPEDLALAGRIRAALASKDTSTKDIEDIITAAGREVTDEMRNAIAANVNFVRQGGDIDLVRFNFLPLAQPEPTPISRSMYFPEGTEAPRYTGSITSYDPTFQERAYQFVREQAAPFFGADPDQSRRAAELLVGRRDAPRAALMDITPLAALTSLPEGASTFSRGVRFGEPGTAALGALETVGGVAEALPLAGPLFRGSRRFAREFTRTSPAAGGGVSREAVEAFSPSQVPPTAPAPRPPLTPIERIAQAPTLPPAAPVAAIERIAQAPELPPVRPSAQPSGSLFRGQPEQFTNLQTVGDTDAIDNILIGRGIFTTSDRDLAATYGPNVFEFERPNPAKVFDLSNPSEKDLRKLLPEEGFEDTAGLIRLVADQGDLRASEDILFEALAAKHLPEDVNWQEVKNGFTIERGIFPDEIRDLVSKDIQDAGFDFVKHQGGIRAGSGEKLHDVFIALRDGALVPKTKPTTSGSAAPLTPIERIAQAPELPPVRLARPAPAPEVPLVSAEQRAEDAFSLDVRTPTAETQVILTPAKQKEIMAYQADYARLLNERGITQPKGRTQSEWIQSHMQAETIPVDDLLPIMQRHNVASLEDQLRAAGISRESLSRSGRDLNQASQLRRLLLRAAQENPQLAEQLGVGADAIKEASSVHRRLMGIESALLTTQVKTIIRNLVGATPQMPAFTMVEELTDAAIRGARNLGRAPENRLLGPSIADPLYAFWDTVGGSLVDAARATADVGLSKATRGRANVSRSARALRNERTIKELRDAFPNEYSTLFGRYASDQVSRGPSNTAVGKALTNVEKALDVAHIGTRTMDRWVKNTQFPVLLDMELRRVGRSLDEVFDAGDFASIPEPVLDNAIRRMHKRVFEDRPEGPEWYNRASKAFIDLLNYTARPAGVAPFPNFMVSFGKYVFEQNPAAVVRFASKAERKKIAEGDARAIGKIAAGLASTLAWSATKDFDDGTDWFEFYTPDGEVVDVSAAAAPSLPSLWQAYLLHKYNTGRLNEVKWSKDIAKVVGASNMRAGFSGYMVDSGFADIVDAAQQGRSAEQIQKMFGEYMAQRVGGWTLFFRNFRDIAAESGQQDTTLRTPETIAQSTMSNLPFGVEMYTGLTGQEIPARFVPTRAGALQEQDPLLGQLTGGFFRGKRNPLEQQLIQLGVAPSSLNRASGISDTYDRLLTEEIGDIAEKQLLPFLDERAPLGETPEKQRLLLGDEYTKIRKAARNRVLQNYPIYRFATTYENLSRDEKRLADKKNMEDPQRGRSVPEFVSEVESIDPAMPVVRKSGPARELDLAAIPSGTAYADGLTFTIKVKP